MLCLSLNAVPNAPISLMNLAKTTNSLTMSWNQTGVVGSYSVSVNETAQYPYVNYTQVTSEYVIAIVYDLPVAGVVYLLSVTALSNNLASQTTSSGEFVTGKFLLQDNR